ncbi:MAG TPA: cyclase family protein [Gaiellaceae bacterium]|nr:cyclase family protein [Gaiellaceae bacterium]
MLGSARVVDLTHTLTPEFPLFPAYDPVRVADKFTVEADGFAVRSWAFDEHSGTHVDAPAHFGGELTVDRIDPAELVLPAVVLDVRDRLRGDDDGVVLPDDVRRWEREHGSLPERCVVLALTGWGARAPDPVAYLNQDEHGTLHSPGFSEELAQWLVAERPGVRGLGLDTASLDRGATTAFEAHTAWLPTGRYGIENLNNLEQVPPAGAWIAVGAPKLQAGTGGPARILALVP